MYGERERERDRQTDRASNKCRIPIRVNDLQKISLEHLLIKVIQLVRDQVVCLQVRLISSHLTEMN